VEDEFDGIGDPKSGLAMWLQFGQISASLWT
jgi:hypothetical protein